MKLYSLIYDSCFLFYTCVVRVSKYNLISRAPKKSIEVHELDCDQSSLHHLASCITSMS